MTPPLGDVAHLGHVELLTPDPDRSPWFFTTILGLTENGRSGDSVHLRTWDDYEHHSLTLTAHSTSGIRRTALRAAGAEALHRRVEEAEAAGLPGRWADAMSSIPTPRAAGSRGRALAVLVVALCWTVVLFDGLDLFIYGAVLPGMLGDPDLGLSPGRAGDLGSYATFGMLLGALSAGIVTDRIGRKKVIIGCTTVFSLVSAVCAMAPGLGVFGVARFVAGSAWAVCCPPPSPWSPNTPRAAAATS
ncbi:catechol 2,3-dioxygenase-like lactoylglutathione lyase family enzyme [Streptomyces rapamycinicus]|uniref:Benzoate transporter n=2 Tax=Streptomyces rapamycinicus TaxID=1226757 RepID=A0A3L8QZ60_STRRN|nr:MFS transporter [Streptomyces rapamycinicus]MBB4788269.1 catechol 2,3-dioxygenase-like lactoylglutathione lyase family enzyme [Streptomyces rapamycinicus]RLV72604.1 benzoate transporter [Streptomyces rapamycinicus NRRL 5491]